MLIACFIMATVTTTNAQVCDITIRPHIQGIRLVTTPSCTAETTALFYSSISQNGSTSNYDLILDESSWTAVGAHMEKVISTNFPANVFIVYELNPNLSATATGHRAPGNLNVELVPILVTPSLTNPDYFLSALVEPIGLENMVGITGGFNSGWTTDETDFYQENPFILGENHLPGSTKVLSLTTKVDTQTMTLYTGFGFWPLSPGEQ